MDRIGIIIDSVSSDITYLIILSAICAVLILVILARFLTNLVRTNATLEGIKKGIEDASEQEREALDNLRKAVSGESESSLLSQVQKLRTDYAASKNSQGELIKEFRRFAEMMAENNSKALIESLAQVIQNSNAQLIAVFA